jgi:dihydrodipicolinate synthase/N-acetylneuraminate lyase
MPGEDSPLKQIRSMVEGPVNSIPTPFKRDGAIDWDGVAAIVERGIVGGSRVSLLTYGDSQFDFLSDDEVCELTRFVVERVNGRALIVAATRRWPDDRAVEFAHFSKRVGADVLMVLPSDFAGSAGRIQHYRGVAAVMPMMLVGCPGYDILDALLDVPEICTFKEDGTEAYAVETMRRYGDQWVFVTGGQLWRHYTQWPFGCRAYFCWLAALAPSVSQRYWSAFCRRDVVEAGAVIREVEAPFFALAGTVNGGWFALWRTALALNGVSSRYLRPPLIDVTEEEVERISDEMKKLGIAE